MTNCLSQQNFLDVVELVQGFEWSEVVHVSMDDFIAHLGENRVVELKERELRFRIGRTYWLLRSNSVSTCSARRTTEGTIPAIFAT